MSIAYFPTPYFDYVMYGSSASTQPVPEESPNWLYDVLEGIATTLGATFGHDSVRIVIDPNDFAGNDPNSGTQVEIGVKSLDTVSFSDAIHDKYLVVMRTDIRIRIRFWDKPVEKVGLTISKVHDSLTGNDFGSICVGPRSRIVEFRSKHLGQGDYDLRFVLEVHRIVVTA